MGPDGRAPLIPRALRYLRPMLVRRFDDPGAFREAALPYLTQDEARHNLLLGITSNLVSRPGLHELYDLWVASDGDAVAGVALRTPPYNLVLAQPRDEAALDAIVDRLLDEGQDPPGVVAALPELDGFVASWTASRDVDATLVMRQGVYELREVLPIPAPPGSPRAATREDRDLLVGWIRRFAEEVLPDEPEAERQARVVEDRLDASEHAGIWIWEDGGRPVAMSGYGSETPKGIRIGPVYTPPELRGRGYATGLVSEQSRWLLGTGRRFCFLYTDLDNPTSNALYRRIGYRMIAESAEVRFDPKSVA
jgi:RimJ/RimL family protein N-acetyltransferase